MHRVAKQFDIAPHYDAMTELDRDVHDDVPLARAEVGLALDLFERVPETLFLPCVGTGRHIPHLLEAGVGHIVGVDLSEKCLEKARARHEGDERVVLVHADLLTWQAEHEFDAVMLLGNSYGDLIDRERNHAFTEAIARPLLSGGTIVLDYIGRGYLERASRGTASAWDATLFGRAVKDTRTPRYDNAAKVMTIDVVASDEATSEVVWRGAYQKLVMSDLELMHTFDVCGVTLRRAGRASEINSYYRTQAHSLGMIATSTWWIGEKR